MKPDPWDQKTEDICERCGGTGKMPAPPPPDDAPRTKEGDAAALIDRICYEILTAGPSVEYIKARAGSFC